eukprot:gene7145-biopygen4985
MTANRLECGRTRSNDRTASARARFRAPPGGAPEDPQGAAAGLRDRPPRSPPADRWAARQAKPTGIERSGDGGRTFGRPRQRWRRAGGRRPAGVLEVQERDGAEPSDDGPARDDGGAGHPTRLAAAVDHPTAEVVRPAVQAAHWDNKNSK